MAKFLVNVECVDEGMMAEAIRMVITDELAVGHEPVSVELVGNAVLLTEAQYNSLVESEQHLALLECRGVDNWSGYCSLPSRQDYDTEGDWYDAIYKASESW